MSENELIEEPAQEPEAATGGPAVEDPEIVLHSDEAGFEDDCSSFSCGTYSAS